MYVDISLYSWKHVFFVYSEDNCVCVCVAYFNQPNTIPLDQSCTIQLSDQNYNKQLFLHSNMKENPVLS